MQIKGVVEAQFFCFCDQFIQDEVDQKLEPFFGVFDRLETLNQGGPLVAASARQA